MNRYGLPYQGSKNKIANWVVDSLPSAKHFYDLFCGGCAVTHAAMLRRKYQHFHVNDITEIGGVFCDIVKGRLQPDYRWISREEFERLKNVDPIVRIVWSFGNNGNDYLYGKDREELKKAMHYAVVFGDYSLSDALGIDLHCLSQYDDIEKRYSVYKDLYAKAMCHIDKTLPPISFYREYSAPLQAVGNLNRVKMCQVSIKKKTKLVSCMESGHGKSGTDCEHCQQSGGGKLADLSLDSSQGDYQDVEILPDSVVYCDIPYRDTRGYNTKGNKKNQFDYDRFYSWADSRNYPVFISEYNMPSDFIPIARQIRIGTMCKDGNREVREEKIFVQKRYAKQYLHQLFV